MFIRHLRWGVDWGAESVWVMGESGLFQLQYHVHRCDSPTVVVLDPLRKLQRQRQHMVGILDYQKHQLQVLNLLFVVYQSWITLQEITKWGLVLGNFWIWLVLTPSAWARDCFGPFNNSLRFIRSYNHCALLLRYFPPLWKFDCNK